MYMLDNYNFYNLYFIPPPSSYAVKQLRFGMVWFDMTQNRFGMKWSVILDIMI